MENCKLKDYEGNYERFLEKNEGEADVMAEKEAKKKELEKSQIKAKSKARARLSLLQSLQLFRQERIGCLRKSATFVKAQTGEPAHSRNRV